MYKYRQYNFCFQKCLNYPIRVALFEQNISVNTLLSMVQGKGIKYTYFGLAAFIDGKNISNLSLTYISNLYEALSLPCPDANYLLESYNKWLSIKAFKLDRRNANRIKKGLQPVNSISTRIK